jgi:hypothetical protein
MANDSGAMSKELDADQPGRTKIVNGSSVKEGWEEKAVKLKALESKMKTRVEKEWRIRNEVDG